MSIRYKNWLTTQSTIFEIWLTSLVLVVVIVISDRRIVCYPAYDFRWTFWRVVRSSNNDRAFRMLTSRGMAVVIETIENIIRNPDPFRISQTWCWNKCRYDKEHHLIQTKNGLALKFGKWRLFLKIEQIIIVLQTSSTSCWISDSYSGVKME